MLLLLSILKFWTVAVAAKNLGKPCEYGGNTASMVGNARCAEFWSRCIINGEHNAYMSAFALAAFDEKNALVKTGDAEGNV